MKLHQSIAMSCFQPLMLQNSSIVLDNLRAWQFSSSQVETESIVRVILACPSTPEYPQDFPEGKLFRR